MEHDITGRLRAIYVGTDCSGMEAPLVALRQLGIRFKHRFSCENDRHARTVLRANFAPDILYRDIRARSVCNSPEVDLYVAGFPCQSFSSAGHRMGFVDARGTIFADIFAYIARKEPRAFILENVVGLLHVQGGQCFATIVDALTRLRIYNIYWQKLNASDYGVPQHRPRIFIVGILKVWDIGFSFPQPIKCRDIQHFLSPRVGRPSWANMPLSNVARTNVMRGLEAILSIGRDPFREPWFINCGSSPERSNIRLGVTMCLTRSRPHGHWITNRGRYMNVEELMRLQGFPSSYRWPVTPLQCGQLLGNSMCVDVLVHLLRQVLLAAQLD